MIILAATIHDQTGSFVPILEKWFDLVRPLFYKIVVSSSPNLHKSTKKFLQEHSVELHELNKI